MNLYEETLSQGQNRRSEKIILVIEDDASIGEMLIEAISDTSYQAFLVSDGQQALQVVHVIKPALFITDYRLPKMNGIELYDRLHAQQELADTPAIIISACLPKEEVKQRNLISLEKPFELDEFISTIEQLIEDRG